MKIHLSALGWIDEPPAGNRLRWSCSGALPDVMVVERTPVHEDLPISAPSGVVPAASMSIPIHWWDNLGDVAVQSLYGMYPLTVYRLPSTVQAVRFTYAGTPTRMQLVDAERSRIVLDRMVQSSATVLYEGECCDLIFHTTGATLQGLHTLDLFRDRGLTWTTIAEIEVAQGMRAAWEQVQPRYPANGRGTPGQWRDLTALVRDALAGVPAQPGKPGPWESVEIVLGSAWEASMIAGYGFLDGPNLNRDRSALDRIAWEAQLPGVPTYPVAYRVRVVSRQAARQRPVPPSNLVVCPPRIAPPLRPPAVPEYRSGKVRLLDGQRFEARAELHWSACDPRAQGIEVEEVTGPSPIKKSAAVTSDFQCRSPRADDLPGEGTAVRIFDVPFYDVTLQARARAIDGWDRVSPFTAYSTPVPLALMHQPQAPPLAAASWENGITRLKRPTTDGAAVPWQPDIIVEKAAAHRQAVVEVCRQTGLPRVLDVDVAVPGFAQEETYGTLATTPGADLTGFDDGYFIAGRFRAAIRAIVGQTILFEAPQDALGAMTLFAAGPARLQQNPLAESLWTPVAAFPVAGLPSELVFADALPGPFGRADTLAYAVRVRWLGRTGPFSNIVRALRVPATPQVPPPFEVMILGRDFYDRALVQIRLTNPADGEFLVWWADGTLGPAEFANRGVPGIAGSQEPVDQRYLYDALALPLMTGTTRAITIGLQRVNPAGGQSGFQTVAVTTSS
jgi:hypothetical protein